MNKKIKQFIVWNPLWEEEITEISSKNEDEAAKKFVNISPREISLFVANFFTGEVKHKKIKISVTVEDAEDIDMTNQNDTNKI